jgi:hypothetical protein
MEMIVLVEGALGVNVSRKVDLRESMQGRVKEGIVEVVQDWKGGFFG